MAKASQTKGRAIADGYQEWKSLEKGCGYFLPEYAVHSFLAQQQVLVREIADQPSNSRAEILVKLCLLTDLLENPETSSGPLMWCVLKSIAKDMQGDREDYVERTFNPDRPLNKVEELLSGAFA